MRKCHFWTFGSEWAIDNWKDFNFTWQSFQGFDWTNGWSKWRVLFLTEKMHEQTWIAMFLKVWLSKKSQDCISKFWKPAKKTLTCWHWNLSILKFRIPIIQIHNTWTISSINSIFCPVSLVSSHSNLEMVALLKKDEGKGKNEVTFQGTPPKVPVFEIHPSRVGTVGG